MTRRTPASFPRTDSGNAELIAAKYRDYLRFDHRRKIWLVWKDRRWTEDQDGQVCRMAKEAARDRLKGTANIRDDEKRDQLVTWALKSESQYRLRAALELAKTTLPVSDAGDGWDSDPFLLGLRNGVLDLRTGQLRPAQPEDRITIHTPIPFAPKAHCPRFEQFLSEVFLGDSELVGFVQRAVGYCLTGNVSEQCLFLCYGEGANGKSTFLETIRYVFGGYAHNLPFSAFELAARSGIPNDLAGLVGKRLVTAVETSENARFNESRIKALTGEDRCTARFLYGEYFSFDPTAKFWLAFNHKPHVSDDSHGFWRRMRLIPFLTKFDSGDADKKLAAKLRAESSGILAWAVRGCLLWQQQGLRLPRAVSEATKAYREESDPLTDFLDRYECFPEAFVTSARLRDDYHAWTTENYEKPLDSRTFAQRLRARGFRADREGHKRDRGWRGLKPRDDPGEICCENADARTGAATKIQ